MNQDAISFHSAIAVQFDGRYEQSVAFRERFRVWTALLDQYVRPTDRVMDLGCGSGVFSQYLADRGCAVTGIDGSTAMIDLCNRKKTVPTVRYVVQTLPLTNPAEYEPQDVIIASSLLEYMDDMNLALRQAWVMLKPGGTFIVSVPNQPSVYRRIERLLFRLTGRPRYFAHIRNVLTATTFNQQLSRAGFAVLETVYFAGHDPVSRLLRPLLAEQYVNNLLVGVYRKAQ